MEGEVFRNHKVLVLPAAAKDGETCKRILQATAFDFAICGQVADLIREIDSGAGMVVIAEDALRERGKTEALRIRLSEQPPWSHLPLVLISKGGAGSAFAQALVKELGSMLVLERPVSVSTLLNAVESSLLARERQYDVRDHLTERERAEAALKEADRKKDEFLAVLAHELRNPMAAISTAASLLSRENLRPDQVRMATGALKKRVGQLSSLVDDLLDVSRIARGKIDLHRELIDLAVVVVTAVETTQSFFIERRQKIRTELREPLLIDGDPVRLEQVISNLLTNASRYTPDGGNVLVSVLREGKEAVVRVTDDGLGIPKESLAKIFELFGQAEDSLHRSKGGLGIGLTIVRKLTEMHGGSVTAQSEGPGKGSTFTLRFPLASLQIPLALEEKGETRASVAPGLRVLIVEDNQDTAVMSSALLELAGHEVKVALDGPSGVQVALAEKPDVVLLDIGLPGMDGFQVAREIRNHGLRDMLIVAVTGYGQEQDLRRGREVGIDHHLLKPLNPLKLNPLLADYQKGHGWKAAP